MTYDYQCPKCKGIWELSREVDARDDPYECSMCEVECPRIISKASFIIHGYSEKNGYSSHVGDCMDKSLHGKRYK